MKLSNRENNILVDSSGSPAWGASYVVRAFSLGAIANGANDDDTTVTVHAGHSFYDGDKMQISGTGTIYEVSAATQTTVTFTANVTVLDKATLVNLGPDTGSGSTPAFDAIKFSIYSDSDGTDAISQVTGVVADAYGNYEYWHRGSGKHWEVVYDTSGAAQSVVAGVGAAEPSVYNVIDYGAEVDPRDGIQSAIEACEADGGGKVFVPALTYAMAAGEQLLISSNNVTFEGQGDASHITQTNTSEQIPFRVTGSQYKLRDFKFTHTAVNDANYAIEFNGGDNGEVSGLNIVDAGGIALGWQGVTDSIWVHHCRTSNSIDGGIYSAGGATNFSATDNFIDTSCTVSAGTNAGITFLGHSNGTDNILISRNTVKDCASTGIRVQRLTTNYPSNVRIVDNHIDHGSSAERESGIKVSLKYGTISGNRINAPSTSGIVVNDATDSLSVIGNVISNVSQGAGTHGGINLAPGGLAMKGVVVSGNSVLDTEGTPTTDRGMSISDPGAGSIEGIVIVGNVHTNCTDTEFLDESALGDASDFGNVFSGLNAGGSASISAEPTMGIVKTAITASVTQSQGQVPLYHDLNHITVCANANDAVTLPGASVGRKIVVVNNGAALASVFPASGDTILGASQDEAVEVPVEGGVTFYGIDDTTWFALESTAPTEETP
jgi:hypothetical protein